MPHRPKRPRIQTELGKMQTPPDGARHIAHLPGKGDVLILGAGPDPATVAGMLPAGKAVYVIEAHLFKSQMSGDPKRSIPPHWREIAPESLTDDALRDADIFLYRPGLRHFPSFFGPLIARCRWLKTLDSGIPELRRYAILPGNEDSLLIPELLDAFERTGLKTRRVHPKQAGSLMPHLLQRERPALFFSVNFSGFDPYGELFHLLRAADVPVATWCVDNPFHLISGLRSPFWREMPIFVTDASFIPLLHDHGAEQVFHLPLAAWPEHAAPTADAAPNFAVEGRLTFVGRSAFPNKGKFFAGCRVDEALSAAAQAMLRAGQRPDFSWWVEQTKTSPLWPGNAVRNAGFGAEAASRQRRIMSLQHAATGLPLVVFGDSAWKEHLPQGTDIRSGVDYYTELPGIYRQSAWNLNVTSLLLPAGLTQRHFDVWAAGGFLLTDDTPGLDIFPDELTREITFAAPGDIPELAKRLAPDTTLRKDLAAAWHRHILDQHTYGHRVRRVLDILGIDSSPTPSPIP